MIFTYGYLFYIPINVIYAAAILFSGKKGTKNFHIIFFPLYLQYM